MKPVVYRASQFFHYWRNAPLNPDAQTQVDSILPSPELRTLFRQMSAGEQRHSLEVLERIDAHYPSAPAELRQAALLHDVGKTVAPMNIVERVLVVVGRKLFPAAWQRWGQGRPAGWRKAFVVACQHARWGADLATQAGAAPLVVKLIRRHQTSITTQATLEDKLLQQLQTADNAS